MLSGGTWTSPIGIDSGTQLNGVSCPTSSFCVAVDNNGQGFTYTGSATNWARTTIDPNQDELNSVSCPSTTFCVAVVASRTTVSDGSVGKVVFDDTFQPGQGRGPGGFGHHRPAGQCRNRAQQRVIGDRHHSSAASAHRGQHGVTDGRAHHRDAVGDGGGSPAPPGPAGAPSQARTSGWQRSACIPIRRGCRVAAADEFSEALVERHQRGAVANRDDHQVREPAAKLFPHLEGNCLLRLDGERVGAGVAVKPAERAGGGP